MPIPHHHNSWIDRLSRAGWSLGEGAQAKEAALAAGAAVPAHPPRRLTLTSEGRCLIIGSGQPALEVASALNRRMAPIVLLTDVADASPLGAAFPVGTGRIESTRGHFTAFEISVSDLRWANTASRSELLLEPAGETCIRCDVILDLSGRPSLFPGCEERDGYIRANPRDALGLARAVLAAADLTGEIEKPLYVEVKASICAHARNRITGCSNCLDTCPAGAIAPDGDAVAIDAGICEGCGLCAAGCPTGAISYRLGADHDVIARARATLEAYADAGGHRAVLLLHEPGHGEPIFEASARYGDGLPANVIPLPLSSVAQAGHDVLLALLLAGAEHIALLVPRRHHRHLAALEQQTDLAAAILAGLGYGDRIAVIAEDDPSRVEAALTALAAPTALAPMPARHFGLVGSKREVVRSALAALHRHAPLTCDLIKLPAGSPYGQVLLDQQRCTLCLACVSACPTGALRDTPEQPALRFAEAQCVQCGICVATCPEDALGLDPRLDLATSPAVLRTLKAEEPHCCARCGKPFGTRAAVDRVKRRLESNPHFADARRLAMLDLCGDCRVVALMAGERAPMASRPRPRPVASEDYVTSPGKRGR